jgi:hypothetical protein
MMARCARKIDLVAKAPAALPALRSGQANCAAAPLFMIVATRD